MHKQTQAIVDVLILQISALVALISRDPKPTNEDESHTLTISSKNKRNSTDSPPPSSSGNDQTRKRINDSSTPVKRLFAGYFGNGASTSAGDNASNSQIHNYFYLQKDPIGLVAGSCPPPVSVGLFPIRNRAILNGSP
jgi:hypothetical protein